MTTESIAAGLDTRTRYVDPGPGPDRDQVLREAAEQGHADGKSGMYDEWSFATGTVMPYLASLEAARDHHLALIPERVKRDAAQNAAAERAAHEREQLARRALDHAAREEQRARDLFAAVGERAHGFLSGGRKGLPGWIKAGLLTVLVMVDLPIQYAIFTHLRHGTSWVTIVFTVGVAAVMILAPHLAGFMLRRRAELGSRIVASWGAVTLLAAWAGAVAGLAYLRQAVMFKPSVDLATGARTDPFTDLHFGRWWAMLLFAAIMLTSGGIALLMGYVREHPAVAAVRRTAEAWKACADEHRQAVQELTYFENVAEGGPADQASYAEAYARLYDEAAQVYRHKVAQTMGKPAVTESIGHPATAQGR